MSKQFWGLVAVIIAVLIGVAVFNNGKKPAVISGVPSSHIIGKVDSKVKFVEYGDYQCPYCQQYFPTVNQIKEKYKDRVSFQFLNFPLTNSHKNAFAAARAAEAADKQGKFWEMHDLLYQGNDPTGASGWVASDTPFTDFSQYAKQLGLDADKFKKDYASAAINNVINADMAEGTKANVQGTPAFFINGKLHQVQNSVDAFSKLLDEALKNAK